MAKKRQPHRFHGTITDLSAAGVTQVIMPDVRPPVFKEAHLKAVEAWASDWYDFWDRHTFSEQLRDPVTGLVAHAGRAKP